MRAIVRREYGSPDVLKLKDIDKPAPKDDEVLARVHAAGVNMADVDYLLGRPNAARLITGVRRPRNRVLGIDIAGEVEAVGTAVTQFQLGDGVFGDLTDHGFGGFAEYVCAGESAFAKKPANLTFEEAATVPQAGVMALQGLRGKRPIEPGHKVLINGAGGNVGPFAVQIAKSYGAEVTAVDRTEKLDMLRSIGADHVVDFTSEDVLRGSARYDRILDVAASRSIFEWKRILRPRGTYVVVPNSIAGLLQAGFVGPLISIAGTKKMGMHPGRPFAPNDVAFLTDLIEASKLTPVIDRRYPLEEVPDALRYQADGHPRGKIVITVVPAGD
jgi:NADPH:quinone reductase-like Zn-dependent oxidoreductase